LVSCSFSFYFTFCFDWNAYDFLTTFRKSGAKIKHLLTTFRKSGAKIKHLLTAFRKSHAKSNIC
jgi:hypothetical protein